MKKRIQGLLLLMISNGVFAYPHPIPGTYVGLNAGAIFSSTHLSAQQINYIPTNSDFNNRSNTSNFIPGAQVGYIRPFHTKWLGGAELDFTAPNINDTYKFRNQTRTAFDQFQIKSYFQGSVRARLGYDYRQNYMPFLTAGLGYNNVGLRYSNENNDRYAKTEISYGPVLGAGIEYQMTQKLSLRGEYLYTYLGNSVTMRVPTVVNITESTGNAKTNLSNSVLRIALSYLF